MKPDTVRINVKNKASFVLPCTVSDIKYTTERTHIRIDISEKDIDLINNSLIEIKYLKEAIK